MNVRSLWIPGSMAVGVEHPCGTGTCRRPEKAPSAPPDTERPSAVAGANAKKPSKVAVSGVATDEKASA